MRVLSCENKTGTYISGMQEEQYATLKEELEEKGKSKLEE